MIRKFYHKIGKTYILRIKWFYMKSKIRKAMDFIIPLTIPY